MDGSVETTHEFSVNMTCGSCEAKVNKALTKEAINNFKIDLKEEKVKITTSRNSEELKSILESTGLKAVLVGIGATVDGAKTVQSLAAAVSMVGKDGDYFHPGVRGVIRFNQVDKDSCVIEGTVDGLTPGDHGLAVHEAGDVSRGCASLGDHYNPRGAKHGGQDAQERHVGDLGNITAGEDGRATFRIVDNVLKVWDIIGRGLAISSGPDDLGLGNSERSSIDGNCGDRIACGIIARAARMGENTKKICYCDGVTIWDERNKPLAGPGRRA